MGTSDTSGRRYRVGIWLDEWQRPTQGYIEAYDGGDRIYLRSCAVEPFDTPSEVVDACLRAIDRELKLF